MGIEQSSLGKLILILGSAGFVYYSVWLLSSPFVEDDSVLAKAFPPKHWATAVPILVGTFFFCLIAFNVGWSLIRAHPVFQAPRKANGKAA